MGNVTIAELAARNNIPLLSNTTDSPHKGRDYFDYN